MYGKIFPQLYEGSLHGAGLKVMALLPYLFANCDAKGYVEVNPRAVAPKLGCSTEDVREALEFLMEPDPDSRSPEEEGRRVVREGQFLYRIVNYLKYRQIQSVEERRDYQREWDRKNRPSGSARAKKESPEGESDAVRHTPTPPDSVRTGPPLPTQAYAEAEAYEEKGERGGPAVPSPDPTPTPEAPAGLKPSDLAAIWNENRGAMPAVSRISPGGERFRKAKARLAEVPDADRWAAAIRRLSASAFARGLNDRGWRATFDFILRPDTLAKIEEGAYDDRKPAPRPLPGAHYAKAAETPSLPRVALPPAPEDGGDWPRIAARLRPELDERDFDTWIAPLWQSGPTNGSLTLVAPSAGMASQITAEFFDAIVDAARALGIDLPVRIVSPDGNAKEAA